VKIQGSNNRVILNRRPGKAGWWRCSDIRLCGIIHHRSQNPTPHHPSSNSGKHWNQSNSIQVTLSGSVHGPCFSSDAVSPLIVRSGVGFWDVLATSLKRVQAEQYARTVYMFALDHFKRNDYILLWRINPNYVLKTV
jgi:hypothetical protein